MQFKNNQNTILLVPFFHILHTGRVALDTFCFISATTPGPLGLLGVGPKTQTFYILSILLGCLVPWFMGPTYTHRSHQCWAVLDFYEEPLVLVFFKNLEWFEFRQKLETEVWFSSWVTNNTGSGFGSVNQTQFRATWLAWPEAEV